MGERGGGVSSRICFWYPKTQAKLGPALGSGRAPGELDALGPDPDAGQIRGKRPLPTPNPANDVRLSRLSKSDGATDKGS